MSVLGTGTAAADRVGEARRLLRAAPRRRGGALRVGVIGGGIGGLASAHFLLKAGHVPVVMEATDQLGGLGTHFEHAGISIERFYHVILDDDADLRALIGDLGIADRLVWRETGMGFMVDGVLYPFNSALDLLRFGALGLPDRLRTGAAALYLTTLKRNPRDLDHIPAGEWVRRLFGRRVFERIWDPLLRAKFGDLRGDVPAFWLWSYLNREKNGGQEVKGCLRHGYRGLAEALRDEIVAHGGEVRMRVPVTAVDAHGDHVGVTTPTDAERFDAVVSTLPLPLLARVARGEIAGAVPSPDLRYQGVVNVLVISRVPLGRFYWTPVVDSGFAFQGVIEMTHVIPTEWTGGRHLIYVMNYCRADSEQYAVPDAVLERQVVDGLTTLYPHFTRADVEAVYVFRAPYVEPAWTLGYLGRRPAARIGASRVYLCTTAQAYPRVTAWNTSVGLARETVTTLLEDLGTTAAAAVGPV